MNKVERKQQQERQQAIDNLVQQIKEEIRTMNTYTCPTYRNLEGAEKDAAYICVHEAQAYLVQRVDEIYAGFKL